MGCSRRDPRRWSPGLAATALEPQEPLGDRQADRDQRKDGAAEGDAGGGQASLRHQAVASGWIGVKDLRRDRYRKPALIFSSAAEPGQSSFSESVLSGASTVLKWWCRSSGSSSTNRSPVTIWPMAAWRCRNV